MKRVTAVHSGRGSQKQISLLIEGKPTDSLLAGEPEGDKSERIQRCRDAAVRFLRYRPRSEFEVRARLRHHGYRGDIIDSVIEGLKERKLIDDRTFAQFWKDNRDSFRPRSQRLIKRELRQKGVQGDIIDQELDTLDDTESAYRSARDKADKLPHTDEQNFRRRLGEYLKRRGYGYGVITQAVEQVCREQGIIN